MKKAQAEIMGLVIIVILIVFIAIFALTFLIKPKEVNEDVLKLKANALRSSLLKTSLCKDVTIKDELENCIDNYNECIDCNILKGEISKIINYSLEKEDYSFTVSVNDGNNFINIENCKDKITAVSQNLKNGKVELSLCRG